MANDTVCEACAGRALCTCAGGSNRSQVFTLSRREAIRLGFAGAATALANRSLGAPADNTGLRALPASVRATVDQDPNWYLHVAGIAAFKDRLVVTYRKSDEHRASVTMIMTAYSLDGGKTWSSPKVISRLGWDPDHACWVAPQLTRFRDGRLGLLCDRGNKLSAIDWPMLSQWELPPRGMANFLFLSEDEGATWTKPRQVDNVGGEPSYIIELSNGSWMFTRTESLPTTAIKHPTAPWGPNYYRNVAVFSDDKGATWPRTSIVADDPLQGDAESGTVEIEPGHVLAVTRIGDGDGRYGQPSRFVHSHDYGKTWEKPRLSPIYAARPIIRKLPNGKLLVTFRQTWGTTGTRAFIFDPKEDLGFQPASFIWDESRCRLTDGALQLRTEEGTANAVEFNLYPVEDDDSTVELEAEVLVKEAASEGCLLSAGAWVRLLPGRVSLADRPGEGFDCSTNQWHKYRLDYAKGVLTIYVDGREMLKSSTEGIFTRCVRFGNRHEGEAVGGTPPKLSPMDPASSEFHKLQRTHPLEGLKYENNQSHSLWRSVSVKVRNRRDSSVAWSWQASSGRYPDQFRRDRVVLIEPNGSFAGGNSGYSGWDQMPDGRIAIADYTPGNPPAERPLLRVYVVPESDLA
jgi:BNR repeat-like domain